MKKIIQFIPTILMVVALAMVISFFRQTPLTTQGSVGISNEYMSTTTPFIFNASTSTPISLNIASTTNTGSLGSVVITGAGSASLSIYDATTTNRNKRADKATTTLVAFPPNTAAGTYTFDVVFTRGLLVEVGVDQSASSQPTTTITWR